MKNLIGALALILAFGAGALAGPAAQLPPRDDAGDDASFKEFLGAFRGSVHYRNKDEVLAAVAPDIKFSFGEDGGREAFARNFALDDAASKFWDDMTDLLELGAVRDEAGQGFWLPYVYGAWPEEFDAFEYMAVVRKDAVLREAPRPDAKAVRTLNYDIVQQDFAVEERTGESSEPVWVAVILADGIKGFLLRRDVRSPIDYRAHFVKRGGAWQMDVLVAGD